MRVFLSSTYEDLVRHREMAAQAIERLGQQGIRMEVFGARPADALGVCKTEIAEADAFVGLYAHRYGFIPPGSEYSITEQELDYAIELTKPVFCFVINDDHPWLPRYVETDPGKSKLFALKERIRLKVVTDTFGSPEDLAYKVSGALGRFLITARVKQDLDRLPGRDTVSTEQGRFQVARRAARLREIIDGARILLVNDLPRDVSHVIELMRDLSLNVEVCVSSEQALESLATGKFDVVISDMVRNAVEDEGLRFLSRMRAEGFRPPVIFTVGRFDPSRGTPGYAFGITNRVDELLNLVFDALERARG